MSEVDELLGAMRSGANDIRYAAPAMATDILNLIAVVEWLYAELRCSSDEVSFRNNIHDRVAAILRGERGE